MTLPPSRYIHALSSILGIYYWIWSRNMFTIFVGETFSPEMSKGVPKLQDETRQTSWSWQRNSEFKMAAGGHIYYPVAYNSFIIWSILTNKLPKSTNLGSGNSNLTLLLMLRLQISRYSRWRPSVISITSSLISPLFLSAATQIYKCSVPYVRTASVRHRILTPFLFSHLDETWQVYAPKKK